MKKLPAAFYQTPSGKEPVREWLQGLDPKDSKIVGDDIATAEFGWPVGMPVCKSLGGNLYEIRSNVSDKRISRVIFGITAIKMVLLHSFIKKTQKTPKSDLDLAKKRYKEIK